MIEGADHPSSETNDWIGLHSPETEILEPGAAARPAVEAAAPIGEAEPSPELLACLQCILFVAGRPVYATDAARALEIPLEEAREALHFLVDRFNPGGLQVVRVAGGFQMTTRPGLAPLLSRFLEPPPQKLSHPALETLALIAYRQPLTLPEIEAVRGVKSDSSVRTLLERGLIEDAGRKEVVGRPILYRTTQQFLTYLGIDTLDDLPRLASDLPEPGLPRPEEVEA